MASLTRTLIGPVTPIPQALIMLGCNAVGPDSSVDRAFASGAKGRRFESCSGHFFMPGFGSSLISIAPGGQTAAKTCFQAAIVVAGAGCQSGLWDQNF